MKTPWLLLALLVSVQSSTTYKACSNSNDCFGNGNQQLCLVYFTDTTYSSPPSGVPPAVNVEEGVCVQCLTDCDCGINEYCAPDYTVPAFTAQSGATTDQINAVLYQGLSFAGLKVPSVCKPYGKPQGEKCLPTSYLNSQTSWVVDKSKDINHDDSSLWTIAQVNGVTNVTQGFCGKVLSYVPDKQAVVYQGSGRPNPASLYWNPGNLWGTPGVCTKTIVFVPDNTTAQSTLLAGECATSIPIGNTASTAMEWEGVCDYAGDCQVCLEGTFRCSALEGDKNARGVPQMCYGGQWIQLHDGQPFSSYATFGDNVNGQLLLGILVLFIVLILVVVISACCLRPKSASTPKAQPMENTNYGGYQPFDPNAQYQGYQPEQQQQQQQQQGYAQQQPQPGYTPPQQGGGPAAAAGNTRASIDKTPQDINRPLLLGEEQTGHQPIGSL